MKITVECCEGQEKYRDQCLRGKCPHYRKAEESVRKGWPHLATGFGNAYGNPQHRDFLARVSQDTSGQVPVRRSYRITSGRWDVPMSTYIDFFADDDSTAEIRFKEIAARREHAFDTMFLYSVESSGQVVLLKQVRVRDGDGYANDL